MVTVNDARAFAAGLLCANSLPHLASAVAGKDHLTPLAWKRSGPGVNLVWGLLNLGGGLALAATARTGQRRWDERLPAFEAGAAAFSLWMAVTERLAPVNHDRAAVSPGGRPGAAVRPTRGRRGSPRR